MIVIVSTYYILWIGWKIKCLITMDNKFKKSFFVPVTNMLLIYLFASMKLENGHEKDYLVIVLKLSYSVLFYEIGSNNIRNVGLKKKLNTIHWKECV